ncbi:hypothetical protein OKA04_11905 [Luteolibacter flavescens]|uniref:Uncharacterized protein n=1 Tax=Luteolibacter flavescens TaxID=1859460 RepID=A0ABT3FPD2_9BACT|nr:hypothetical protein [Luteolibacter flavescens]MCW1885435.1 hypothetical protein [Luteolibacter flavescens]
MSNPAETKAARCFRFFILILVSLPISLLALYAGLSALSGLLGLSLMADGQGFLQIMLLVIPLAGIAFWVRRSSRKSC